MVMPLCHALHILAHSHTRDDHQVGYQVHGIPFDVSSGVAEWSRHDYVEAWGVVRRAVGLPVDPLPEHNPPTEQPSRDGWHD